MSDNEARRLTMMKLRIGLLSLLVGGAAVFVALKGIDRTAPTASASSTVGEPEAWCTVGRLPRLTDEDTVRQDGSTEFRSKCYPSRARCETTGPLSDFRGPHTECRPLAHAYGIRQSSGAFKDHVWLYETEAECRRQLEVILRTSMVAENVIPACFYDGKQLPAL